mmetsp:Transcript_32938/g.94106  ORF Transcript_32938/g.94106 Transcript_32938/m.94106 type:complete len:204 (+) Transcript_32938:610-1221(+)
MHCCRGESNRLVPISNSWVSTERPRASQLAPRMVAHTITKTWNLNASRRLGPATTVVHRLVSRGHRHRLCWLTVASSGSPVRCCGRNFGCRSFARERRCRARSSTAALTGGRQPMSATHTTTTSTTRPRTPKTTYQTQKSLSSHWPSGESRCPTLHSAHRSLPSCLQRLHPWTMQGLQKPRSRSGTSDLGSSTMQASLLFSTQ